MVIAVATAVEDVSAAKYKQFDKGSKNFGNGYSTSWTAKYNGKTVKTTCNCYYLYSGQSKKTKIGSVSGTMTKVTKNKMKSKMTINLYGSKSTKPFVDKTKLSSKSFYNKYYKKAYKRGFPLYSS